MFNRRYLDTHREQDPDADRDQETLTIPSPLYRDCSCTETPVNAGSRWWVCYLVLYRRMLPWNAENSYRQTRQ